MNAENPVQIDLFGVSATGTKDTRLAEHIGGYFTWVGCLERRSRTAQVTARHP
jgi:hypothetical protein